MTVDAVFTCVHPGGFRVEETGEWECSRCGYRWPDYETWGVETGNEDSVAAVKSAIARDLAQMDCSGAAGAPPWANVSGSNET